jgi:transposase
MSKAIDAVQVADSTTEAAKLTGVGAATLYRWLKTPEFQEAQREYYRRWLVKKLEQEKTSNGTSD